MQEREEEGGEDHSPWWPTLRTFMCKQREIQPGIVVRKYVPINI